MERSIGIIDSGVGGLTVVKEMREILRNEKIIYIGDDKRCPYGPRSVLEVKKFTMEMATTLANMNIKMLVIACNTATAVALDDIRARFSFPVIGVITPGARSAVQASEHKRIAVLGTSGTIKSGAYNEAISKLSPEAVVFSLACPEFVELVEKGQYNSVEASIVTKRTLQGLAGEDFDVTILGCTHYPLLEHHIKKALPESVKIISSAVETVRDVHSVLIERKLLSKNDESVDPIFYTTGLKDSFKHTVIDWLSILKPDVRHLDL